MANLQDIFGLAGGWAGPSTLAQMAGANDQQQSLIAQQMAAAQQQQNALLGLAQYAAQSQASSAYAISQKEVLTNEKLRAVRDKLREKELYVDPMSQMIRRVINGSAATRPMRPSDFATAIALA